MVLAEPRRQLDLVSADCCGCSCGRLASRGRLVALIAALVIFYLIRKWFDARLVESIRGEYQRELAKLNHDFAKKLEDYKEEIKIRAQAARTAELLAVALSSDNGKARELNKLAWELSLWLPANLVIDLANCLAPSENPKHPKEILVEVRKISSSRRVRQSKTGKDSALRVNLDAPIREQGSCFRSCSLRNRNVNTFPLDSA